MAVSVPRYDQRQSAHAAIPGARMRAAPTAEMLGVNQRLPGNVLGQGMAQFGAGMGALAEQLRAQEDADMVMQAEVVLHDMLRQKDLEWSERKGGQARGVTKDATEWWGDDALKAGANLNERQQRAFRQSLEKLRNVSLNKVSKHEAVENRNSIDETAQAKVAAALHLAAANADDPEAIAYARRVIGEAVGTRSALNGWAGPDGTDIRGAVELGKALTAMHGAVVEALLEKSPKAAEEYYRRFKGEIDGGRHADFERKIEVGGRLREVQSIADSFDPANGYGGTLYEAKQEIRKSLEGEYERMAIAEVEKRFADRQEAINQSYEELTSQVYAHLNQYGSLRGLPTSVLVNMKPQDLYSISERMQAKAEAAARRAAAEASRDYTQLQRERTLRDQEREDTSLQLYWTLSEQMAGTQNDTTVTPTFIRGLVTDGKMTERHAAALIKQLDGLTPDAGAGAVHIPTLNAELKPIADSLKLSGQERGSLHMRVYDDILRMQAMLGRPLSAVEIRSAIVERTAKDPEASGWFRTRRKYQTDADPVSELLGREAPAGAGAELRIERDAKGLPIRIDGRKVIHLTSPDDYDNVPIGAYFLPPGGTVPKRKLPQGGRVTLPSGRTSGQP